MATIDNGAQVDKTSDLHETVVVWAGTHIREGAVIGAGTSLGQHAYVGPGAVIGKNCKIQNGAYIYEPAIIGNGVFIGPRVILTNDRIPRALTSEGSPKSSKDWIPVGVRVGDGASLGAGVICVAPITIGPWAMVAAGSVVTKDVPSFALVVGVPARRVGWVGVAGERLVLDGEYWVCPVDGTRYQEHRKNGSVWLDPITEPKLDGSI